MGKDREGRFHPKKGKPTDNTKEGLGVPSTVPVDDMQQDEDITNKYTTDADELAPNVRVKHPNRNTSANQDVRKDPARKTTPINKNLQHHITDKNTAATEPEEMPGLLYKSLFEQLANYTSDCCISVYLPTHKAGMEVNENQDRITFKNTLQRLQTLLQQKGLSQNDIESITHPGYQLLTNDELWRNMSNGLAIFMANNYFRYARLYIQPKETIHINNSFYLRPLLPALADTSSDHFYLLMISKQRAAFFRADAFYMEELTIEDLPNGMNDVVHFEEKDDNKLFRMSDGGAAAANFHGIGAGKPDEKENLALYMKEVDRTLWKEVLAREQAPLLIAGIDYLIPIYKSVSAYQHIWPDALIGNFEHHSTPMLFVAAREKMEPFFKKPHQQALEAYYNKLATPLTSSMPETVIPACYYGKVAHLFVDEDTHMWGSFDVQNNQLQLHATQQEGDDCMVDKAVIQTILHGGQVHMLPKEQMPKGSDMAALMRY